MEWFLFCQVLNFIRTYKDILQLAMRSLWILVTICYHHMKAERKIKPLWKQTIFLSVTSPENTRSMQKLVLDFFYLHKKYPDSCQFYSVLFTFVWHVLILHLQKQYWKLMLINLTVKWHFICEEEFGKVFLSIVCNNCLRKKVVSELRRTTPVKE